MLPVKCGLISDYHPQCKIGLIGSVAWFLWQVKSVIIYILWSDVLLREEKVQGLQKPASLDIQYVEIKRMQKLLEREIWERTQR